MAKKIFFSDRYGLTQAVLEGRKTMTRRTLKVPIKDFNSVRIALFSEENTEVNKMAIIKKYAKYQVGEEVAVAQPYKDIYPNADFEMVGNEFMTETSGWDNKMFVRADLMPHRIRITDIKVERLQEITDEEILKEGIMEYYPYIYRNPEDKLKTYRFRDKKSKYGYYQLHPARDCFAVLIDRISGKGTWERNPWVFAYSFELVK